MTPSLPLDDFADLYAGADYSHVSHGRRVKRGDVSDAVSRNITRILEGLLKNYDKTQRPAFIKGEQLLVPTNSVVALDLSVCRLFVSDEPTKVTINVLIRSMGPISEEDMVRILRNKLLLIRFFLFCDHSK
jgi:hypothetical protein